jgi:hypothetical protein
MVFQKIPGGDMANNTNPHWHLAASGFSFVIPTVIVMTEEAARANYNMAVDFVSYEMHCHPIFRGKFVTKFEEGGLIRWFKCHEECVVVVTQRPRENSLGYNEI